MMDDIKVDLPGDSIGINMAWNSVLQVVAGHQDEDAVGTFYLQPRVYYKSPGDLCALSS